MAIMLFSSQIMKRFVDLENRENIGKFRLAYVLSQLAQFAVLVALKMSVQRSARPDDESRVTIEHPGNPLTGEAPRKETMSARQYDLSQVSRQITQQVIWFVAILLLHRFAGAVQPLVMQAVMPWRTLLCSPVIRIRWWGEKAVGSLKRPFQAAASPLSDLLGGGAKNDKKSTGVALTGSKKTKVVIKEKNAEDDDEFEVPPSIEEVTVDGEFEDESAPLRKRL